MTGASAHGRANRNERRQRGEAPPRRVARSLIFVALLTSACGTGTVEREPPRRMADGVDEPSAPTSANPSAELPAPTGTALESTEPPGTAPTQVPAPPPDPSPGDAPCGDEGVACCSSPNICHPEGGCTLIGWDPCHQGQQCCAGTCRLSCERPEQLLDAWSTEPECDLEPFKTCQSDEECALVEYRRNCCGTRVATGVHVDAVAEAQTLIARCESTATCRDCMPERTLDDIGVGASMHAVACRAGRCVSTTPQSR